MFRHHSKIFFRVRRQTTSAVLLLFVAIVILVLFSHSSRPFASAEVKFTDASKSGLAIVPASCPSSPHYRFGECDNFNPPAEYCSVFASSWNITAGQSTTLTWYYGLQFPYVGFPPPQSAYISPIPGAIPPGDWAQDAPTRYYRQFDVQPTQTTTYQLNVGNGSYCDATITVTAPTSCPAGQTIVNGICATQCAVGEILVGGVCSAPQCPAGQVFVNGICSGQCPTGQHAVGNLCVCDSTNLLADVNGQCTTQICPSGFSFDPGTNQCIAIRQCALANSCSDSTHVLNQCTGAVTNCALNGPGWICQNGSCIMSPPPIASISAAPSLLSPGYTTKVGWTSQNTASCNVTGNNGDGVWTGTAGSHVSSPIQAQTIYTLSCKGFDGSTITKTAAINIIPTEIER